jgi:hypothetical protein
VDLLSQRFQLRGHGVDLLGEIGVPLQQVGLALGKLLTVPRASLLVRLVRSGLRLLRNDHERTGVERHG